MDTSATTINQLVERAQRGDADARDCLFSALYGPTQNFLVYLGAHHHDAEEVASDVLFRVLARIDLFDTTRGVAFKTYLYRAARNQLIGVWRKQQRTRTVSLDAALFVADRRADNDPEQMAVWREQVRSVARQLAARRRYRYRTAAEEVFRAAVAYGESKPVEVARLTGRHERRVKHEFMHIRQQATVDWVA